MSLGLTTTPVLAGLIFLAVVLPRSPARFKREVSVALTSALVYSLMSLPFFFHGLWDMFPRHLQDSYIWLPFWYAFVLTKTLGSFFEVASCSAKGILVSVFAMVFLNYLLPGGASPYSMTETAQEHAWTRWLGKGYHPSVAWIFTACFVYGIFLARWSVCMKQYVLGFFASAIVEFMNPNTSSDSFDSILWDYSFKWNWSGVTLSLVFVTLAAVPLAAFSLPIVTCNRRLRRFFSCRAMASRDLSKVAADTCGSLERLITYFSENSSHVDPESSYLFIKQLGTRRVQMEALLEQAQWECSNNTTRARLRCLERASGLLRDLRQGLRVQLEQVRQTRLEQVRPHAAHSNNTDVRPHLNRFTQAMNDGMSRLVSHSYLHRGLGMVDFEQMLISASTADAALEEASNVVPRERHAQRIFIDCLRNFSGALESFAKGGITELEEIPRPCHKFSLWDWLPHHACFIREQHLNAVRNTVSWLLALTWSCMVRRGTCVTAVSFIFSPSLGSLFDRNINRILGVGIGLALGNLPAVLLLKQNCYEEQCFLHSNTGPIAYILLMFSQWAVSMYGYLATGSKYSYACLLWAGFSGVQMLRGMHTPYGRNGDMTASQLFASTTDNMMGCFIVFGVDILAAHFMASRTTEQVASYVSRSLLNVSDLLCRLRGGDSPWEVSEELSALKDSITGSRYWDQEARKEDFIWTTARSTPYKRNLVDAVLRRVDDVYVATWSLLAAAQRSEEEHGMMSAIRDSLPECVAAQCRLYARVLKASLCEKEGRSDPTIKRVSSDPDSDAAQRIADDLLGDEEQGGALEACDAGGSEARADQAALLVTRAACCAMRLSLLQIQALLREHTFLEAKDWRPEEQEQEEGSEEPKRLVRQWSHVPASMMASWFSSPEEGTEEEDEESISSRDASQVSQHVPSPGGHFCARPSST